MAEKKLQDLLTFLKGLSLVKKIVLISVVVGTIAGMAMVMLWAGKPDYNVLFTNLSQEDAGEILSRLKEKRIPYEIRENGSAILIPKDKIYETRLALASEGLPRGSGVGFEIFDKNQLGMTEFVQNVNYQRALQGELSRTINSFEKVISSRVQIVMPTHSVFVEEEKPAKASVALKIKPGKELTEEEIKGIIHLVSSSVSNLPPKNVTVVDSHGNLLSSFLHRGPPSVGDITTEQLEYQRKVEASLEKRVESMLEEALGPGKAIVRVSCSFDFTKQEETEETFDPRNVVRSEQVSKEVSSKKEEIPVGVPGVASNITPGGMINQKNQTKTTPILKKESKTVNYEISKVERKRILPIGKITKISVAVIVDGSLKKVTVPAKSQVAPVPSKKKKDEKKGDKGKEKKEGPKQVPVVTKWEYVPRSQEEMAKLESIVKRAVNFDEKRGDAVEVVNIPFESTKMKLTKVEPAPKSLVYRLTHDVVLMKYAISFFALLMIFLFVVRPLIRWLTSSGQTEKGEVLEKLPMTVEEIENGEAGDIPLLNESLAQMLTANPEAVLQLVRNEWMNESSS